MPEKKGMYLLRDDTTAIANEEILIHTFVIPHRVVRPLAGKRSSGGFFEVYEEPRAVREARGKGMQRNIIARLPIALDLSADHFVLILTRQQANAIGTLISGDADEHPEWLADMAHTLTTPTPEGVSKIALEATASVSTPAYSGCGVAETDPDNVFCAGFKGRLLWMSPSA
ncbi:MAG: hypothetical protein QOI06_3043 [Nocardioidaceae bacterium]|jgi:hypothetical protein|nr:hypothetical protein [Nocardioidaceae bacterium]